MNTLITGNTKFYSQTQNREFIEILRRNPPFTPEEEIEAFKRLYAGDEKALNEIVARNQRWVYSLAKEFARDEIEVMDYVQEGNIGLLKRRNWTKKPWYRRFRKSWLKSIHVPIQTNLNH